MLMICSSLARNRSPSPVIVGFFGRIGPSDRTSESCLAIRGNLKHQIASFRNPKPQKPAIDKPQPSAKSTPAQALSGSSRTTIEAGLVRDRARQECERALAMLRERFDSLSSREREIMLHVVAGRFNKQIAHDIGITPSTVKVHRTHLMRKMKARSLPELSRMADTLNVRLQ